MDCPDPESLADLARMPGDLRAAIADHASECESCRAALSIILGPPADRERIGRYLVTKRLGAGGMGIVYQARDPELQRDVAIKMLYRGAPAERLRREAQALARLAHPNVVTVYDVGERDQQTFIAMALVDGETLRRWLARERSPAEIVRVLCAAARGIEAAHAAQLVHRDLKPDNVFVARDGNVLVGDFGLACNRGEVEPSLAEPVAVTGDLTETGTILGTPAYMAPEQAAGEATELSDQFSFCVMAYEALYGRRPFAGKNLDELRAACERGEIAKPSRDPGVGQTIERALRRGLSPKPGDRFPSLAELRTALEPRPRRWPGIVGGIAALAAASAVTWFATRPAEAPDPEVTCASARASFAETWNPGRRASWIASLLTAGKKQDAALELAARLDRFADEWTTVRLDTCIAQATGTLVDERAAQRVACLETRRAELDATVASTGPEDVIALWRRVASLPEPATCRDATHAYAPGYQKLVVAAARTRTVDELAAIANRAELEGDERAQLVLSLSLASRALADHRLADADKRARRAITLAELLVAPAERVRAIALSARALCLAGNPESERLLEIAAAAARSQPDAIDEIRHTQARCLGYRRRYAEALPLLLETLEHAIRRYGNDSFEAFDLHYRLVEAYQALGRLEDGARSLAEWSRLLIKLVGGDNAVLETQINSALQRFEMEEAIEYQNRVISNQTASNDPGLAAGHNYAGDFYDVVGDWEAAIASQTKAIALIPANPDEEQLKILAEALASRGEDYLRVDNPIAAATDFARLLELAEKLKRGDLTLRANLGSGRAATERADHARAQRILRDAIPALIALDPGNRFGLGEARFAFARTQWELGDRASARITARDAEANVAQSIDEAENHKATQRQVPFRRTRLVAIERWRAAHP